jgi:hypothetical protein
MNCVEATTTLCGELRKRTDCCGHQRGAAPHQHDRTHGAGSDAHRDGACRKWRARSQAVSPAIGKYGMAFSADGDGRQMAGHPGGVTEGRRCAQVSIAHGVRRPIRHRQVRSRVASAVCIAGSTEGIRFPDARRFVRSLEHATTLPSPGSQHGEPFGEGPPGVWGSLDGHLPWETALREPSRLLQTGSRPNSRRGGHWFDPSIAHQVRGYVDLPQARDGSHPAQWLIVQPPAPLCRSQTDSADGAPTPPCAFPHPEGCPVCRRLARQRVSTRQSLPGRPLMPR